MRGSQEARPETRANCAQAARRSVAHALLEGPHALARAPRSRGLLRCTGRERSSRRQRRRCRRGYCRHNREPAPRMPGGRRRPRARGEEARGRAQRREGHRRHRRGLVQRAHHVEARRQRACRRRRRQRDHALSVRLDHEVVYRDHGARPRERGQGEAGRAHHHLRAVRRRHVSGRAAHRARRPSVAHNGLRRRHPQRELRGRFARGLVQGQRRREAVVATRCSLQLFEPWLFPRRTRAPTSHGHALWCARRGRASSARPP